MKLSKRALNIKASTTMEITNKAAELKKAGKDIVSFAPGEPDFDYIIPLFDIYDNFNCHDNSLDFVKVIGNILD